MNQYNMQAISTCCLLLLVSGCIWALKAAEESISSENFGIYGGSPINITEVPFMAALANMAHGTRCGAVIISDQFVLSDIICAQWLFLEKYWIVTVGTDNIKGGEKYEIDTIYYPPNHYYLYSIALMKLKQKLKFSDRVQAVKLPKPGDPMPKPGDLLEALGFGATEPAVNADMLQSVSLPFIEHEKCEQLYEDYFVTLENKTICAGAINGKGTCNDKGGPLLYKGKLIAISVGGCAVAGLPSMFQNISVFMGFINDVIKINS